MEVLIKYKGSELLNSLMQQIPHQIAKDSRIAKLQKLRVHSGLNKPSQVSKTKDSQKTETARDRDTDGKANWMCSVGTKASPCMVKNKEDKLCSVLMIKLFCCKEGHNFTLEQRPQADLARSLPFTAAPKGPPEALGSLTFQRPFLHKGAPAARGLFLLLVYSVAAAAAFLVALCFRRLRLKGGGGPLEGFQKRLLAGQQHPWDSSGGPQEEDDDDEEGGFLSNTLEACLDLEAEMNLPPLPSQSVPVNESHAINQLMWKLKDEALLFELEQAEAQQTIQDFPQTPAAEPTYPGPITPYEEYQWLGPQASMWEEEEASFLEALLFPPTPSHQTPYDAAEPLQSGSLLQELPSVSSAASAAAAAPAAAADAWHQHVGGPQAAGGSQGAEGLQLLEGAQGVEGLQEVEGPQEVQGSQEVAAPAGAPTPPSPSSGPDSLSLLQQQPEQQQLSSSQEAAASGESGALSVSSAAEDAGSHPQPSKKRKKADDKAKRESSVQETPEKKHKVWKFHFCEKPPPKQRRRATREKVTSALRIYNEVSASGDTIPSTSGVRAPGQPSASQETTNKQTGTGAPQAQPSGPQVGDGLLTVKLHTGETISFAHPPLPTPPNAPPHYRLPLVRPEVIRRHFSISEALVSGIIGSIWGHLNPIRRLFLKPELSIEDVNELVVRTQSVVRHMMTKYQSPVTNLDPTRAKQKLGLRFLGFEVLVIAIQLLGPAMHPEDWFPHLVAAVPTDYQNTSYINTAAAVVNVRLAEMLAEALEQLKRGLRPSLMLTTEIKILLFSPNVAPRTVPQRAREIFGRAIENLEAEEEEEEEEETSSAED
ncbi:hypothetical protein Emed_001162 [Eimeria media]